MLKRSSSAEAFKKNVRTELKSGRSRAQALAIAYATQRAAAARPAGKSKGKKQ